MVQILKNKLETLWEKDDDVDDEGKKNRNSVARGRSKRGSGNIESDDKNNTEGYRSNRQFSIALTLKRLHLLS